MNVIPYRDFSKSKFLPQGELKEEVWYCFVKRFPIVALPTLRQRDLGFVVTMFREGKIDEDTVDCPRFVAFKGASREDSSSRFNLGQLTKRIHGESEKFGEEEARQAQRKDRRRRAPFYLESPIGFTFTWNRPLCAVLMLLEGGGGGGIKVIECPWRNLENRRHGHSDVAEKGFVFSAGEFKKFGQNSLVQTSPDKQETKKILRSY